jgi:hypothetical protein
VRARMSRVYVAVVPAAVILVLIGLLFAGARRPSKIALDVVGDSLVVRISGKDSVYSMSRGMTIPLASIQGVAVAPAATVPRTGVRLPGTGIPGVLRAGSFGKGARRDFWLVRRAKELLVVELQPGEPYRRLVLQVPDARAECLRLRPMTGAYTGTFSS